ncbi:MAG: CinA family protein [Lachnospiraceae bacterium]|nr:CinA family protein [Lachnospiraceae bacterium]
MANSMSIHDKYESITKSLIALGLKISTMESCTAGAIASLITDTEGSSAVFEGSYITYSNCTKIRCGVPPHIIEEFGVYSTETAAAMAACCRNAFGADLGVGVTGSFGNTDPANEDSIPGEVYYAIATEKGVKTGFARLDTLASRYEYKIKMADILGDELLQILSQWDAGLVDPSRLI